MKPVPQRLRNMKYRCTVCHREIDRTERYYILPPPPPSCCGEKMQVVEPEEERIVR